MSWTWTYACCMSWTYQERFVRKHAVTHGSTSEHNTAPSEDLVFNRVNNAMLVPATGQPAGLEQSAERSKTHDSNTVRKFFWCFPLVNNWLYIVQHSYNEIPGHQSRYTCFHNFRGAMVHQSTDWKRKIMSSNPKKQGKDAVIFPPVWNPTSTRPNMGEWRQALIHGSHWWDRLSRHKIPQAKYKGTQPYRQLLWHVPITANVSFCCNM